MLQVIGMAVGRMGANAYIVYEKDRYDAIIIDPGDEADRLKGELDKRGLNLAAILFTHGHFDHIGAAGRLKQQFACDYYIHQLDGEMLTDSMKNLSAMVYLDIATTPAEHLLQDGQVLHLAGMEIKVLHTPGHTKGGVCYLIEDCLFSGDTLFAGSVGRTDFPDGSMTELVNSIRGKLFCLDDATKVYPGHMSTTTIGEEKQSNPFV